MGLQLLTGLWLGAALMVKAQSTSTVDNFHRPTDFPGGDDDTSVTFTFQSEVPRVYNTTTLGSVPCQVELVDKTFSDFSNLILYYRNSTSGDAVSVYSGNFSDTPSKRVDLDPLEALRRSEESPNFSTNLLFQRAINSPYFSMNDGTGRLEIFPNSLGNYKEMLLFFMIVPNGDDNTEGINSPYFAVVDPGSPSASKFINDNNELLSDTSTAEFESTSSNTDGTSPTTDLANGSSGTGGPAAMPGQDTGDKGGSSGLATGAIAGIAVGAAIALILVLALAWFLLRRRRQRGASHPTDVSTPLAAGYGGAAGASSREFMGDKEAGAMVAESPQSQAYTDQPDPRHSTLSGAAIIGNAAAAPANASYTESGHQAYDEAVPAGHSPTDQQPPHHGSASGIRGVDSPVPTASVARHLVDEDMTADEIARLEEEERELDRQIQEAGRRRQ